MTAAPTLGTVRVGLWVYRVHEAAGIVDKRRRPYVQCAGQVVDEEPDKRWILLSKKYPNNRTETVVHEVIHILSDKMHLRLPERVVRELARGLVLVWKDNPDLMTKEW
jgi:hypothetical protein